MTTIILPGFSLSNKDWAEEIKAQLEPELKVTIYYWRHWTTGSPEPDWLTKESERIIKKVTETDSKIFIIAKSIGTAVAAIIFNHKPNSIAKLILCGTPINDFLPGTEDFYDSLKTFPAKDILAIQNESDPHGSFDQAKDFYSLINLEIPVISKPRSDHEYPYSEDFKNFLKED